MAIGGPPITQLVSTVAKPDIIDRLANNPAVEKIVNKLVDKAPVRQLSEGMTNQVIKLAKMNLIFQRVFVGLTALATIPFIDYFINPGADEQTRKYASVRSAIKITICTLSGVLMRWGGGKLGNYLVKSNKVPFPIAEKITEKDFIKRVSNIFMMYGAIASVFLLDIPFINKILNMVIDKYFKKPDANGTTTNAKKVSHYA